MVARARIIRVRYRNHVGTRSGESVVTPVTVGTDDGATIQVRDHEVLFMTLISRARKSNRFTLWFTGDMRGEISAPRKDGRGEARCTFKDLIAGGYLAKRGDVYRFTFRSYDHWGWVHVGDMEIKFDFVPQARARAIPKRRRRHHK